jgi:DNA-binding transcriptional LysR family regulator
MVLHSAAPQLTDLELLLSVNRLGSLGKAAREHGLSQPAASVRIQGMERRLGLRLLERSPSGSHFTPAGAALAKWAQTAIDAVSQLMACSAALNDAGSGSLRISTCLTVAEYLIPRWVTGLRAQFPALDVRVQANNLQIVLENARAGKADLGFVSGSGHHPDLHQRVVGHDELVVVVTPDHPWAHLQTPLTPAELATGRLVLREKGFGSRETLRQALGDLWRDNAHLELPSTTAIKEALEVGAGAGVLSLLTTARDLEEGRLVRVPVAHLALTRKLFAVWDKQAQLSPAAKAMLDLAMHEQRSSTGSPRFVARGLLSPCNDLRPLAKNQRQVAIPEASAS